MNNRIIFNFSFHRVSLDGKTDSDTVALYCEGVPHTCGNYKPSKTVTGALDCESFIFKAGHGTPSDKAEATASNEEEARKWLMERAVSSILTHHSDSLPTAVRA